MSISRRFSIAIIGVVFLIISVFSIAIIIDRVISYEAELQNRLSFTSELAKLTLASPLWYMNYEFLEDFLTALLLDNTIVGARILVNDAVIAEQVRSDLPDVRVNVFEEPPNILTQKVDITHEGKVIGQIHLAASRKTITQEIIASTVVIASLAGLLLVTISLVSMLITKRYIERPMSQVIHLAKKISHGELDVYLSALHKTHRMKDEFGRLLEEFQQMLTYLQEMAKVATKISEGDIACEVEGQHNQHDILGNAFQKMIAYLQHIGQTARKIEQGNLRQSFEIRSPQDRIGMAFASMSKGIIAMISDIRDGASSLSSVSNLVLSSSSKSTQIVQRIGKSAEETSSAMFALSSSAEEIRVNMETLNTSVEDTSEFIHQMESSSVQVAENSQQLFQFTEEASDTMAQIAASLKQISQQTNLSRELSETTTHDAQSGYESVEHMIDSITTISDVTRNISQRIEHLEHHALKISTILDVINEVAEQTSLLALNASIISAQAGSHGKGFAVVADEIKGLAMRVRTSTKEISDIVRAVQQESTQSVAAIHQGRDEVEKGVMLAHQAEDALQQIRKSAEKSATVAAEIATLVDMQTTRHSNMTQAIQDVSTMSQQMSQEISAQKIRTSDLSSIMTSLQNMENHVLKVIREQQQNTLQVTTSMQDVLQLVHEHSQTIEALSASASELTFQSEALAEHVNRFQIPTDASLPKEDATC